MPGRWAGSRRRDELPADWVPVVRPAVLARDGYRCTWLDGYPDGGHERYLAGRYHTHQRCQQPARDVDHVGDRHDHRPESLRSLCGWHHDRRSSAQGNAARRRPSNRRPVEEHPGLRAGRRAADPPPF